MVYGRTDHRDDGGDLTAEYLLCVYDLRDPESVERLHRERTSWRDFSDIEALDVDHFVLVVRPGGAERIAA